MPFFPNGGKVQEKLLNNIDYTLHKLPIMLLHCNTATAIEDQVLALRQDAAFVMIMEHKERHRDTQSTIKWYEF